jgi:hypothetical protein
MLARYHLNIHNTPTEQGTATIDFGGPRSISVTASASEDSEDTLVLMATASFEPKDNVRRVFEDLAAGVLPVDAEPFETLSFRVGPGEKELMEKLTHSLGRTSGDFRVGCSVTIIGMP